MLSYQTLRTMAPMCQHLLGDLGAPAARVALAQREPCERGRQEELSIQLTAKTTAAAASAFA